MYHVEFEFSSVIRTIYKLQGICLMVSLQKNYEHLLLYLKRLNVTFSSISQFGDGPTARY